MLMKLTPGATGSEEQVNVEATKSGGPE